MVLYLIRHGKTDARLENRRQSPSTPLGEYGKRQAQALAAKMNLSKIDHLYSSDWPRALQTAQILSIVSSLKIKTHPLVHEIIYNSRLDEVSEDSEINLRFTKEGRENSDSPDWKFDGEGESSNEVIERAKKVIVYLEKEHPNDTVAIVSHGIFISAMTSLILLGLDYDKKVLHKLSSSLKVHNTGVSSYKYDPATKHWTMLCFNDHDHLENES